MAAHLHRLLLAAGHAHGHDEHAAEAALDAHAEHAGEAGVAESTLDLRIAAIFVIWIGAVLMGLPTLVFKAFRSQDAPFPRIMRAFSGGLIVALALIHIIPECVLELEGLMSFHIAGVTVLFGIVVLVLIDNSLAAFLAPEEYKQQIRDQLAQRAATDAAARSGGSSHSCHGHGTGKAHVAAAPADSLAAKDVEALPAPGGDEPPLEVSLKAAQAAASAHGHQCLRSLNATGWAASAASPLANVRQYVTAYTMELGCVFHSFIIGLGVGVITNNRELVVTLMVALAIHQGLEALALGSVLALTSFPAAKKIAMLLLYSITTPLGIVIGISIAAGYDPESVTSRAVQGTFNGVSGGMLTYIGMYQLIAEEFSREDLLVRPRLRYGMYAALLAGAAVMAILGIWS